MMDDRRTSPRVPFSISAFVRKMMPDRRYTLLEFRVRDVSIGGMFITSDDLSVFDLKEEIEFSIDDRGRRFYEGKARIVRSDVDQGSGFGVQFLEESDDGWYERVGGGEDEPPEGSK